MKKAPWTSRDRARRRAGLTLTEVMVSLFVFGTATGGLYYTATAAMRISSRARTHYVAVNMARNRVEAAKARDFSQIDQFLESNVVVNMTGRPETGGEFRRSTSVAAVGDGLMEVVVTVDIRDTTTRQFLGEQESISARLTEFKERPR